ncbi:MAG: hypothetical protein GC146_17265 [Limimaricola sp.]|uniref:BCCT family transporter n=1 Tax=Limimaricola sp. TaxID=2211665 RepID=UPI001DD31801|nr:BCCT family transporter [Limimaricola sp.]MBI1418963.1 hypothetical protein [Limimaricola sp.]
MEGPLTGIDLAGAHRDTGLAFARALVVSLSDTLGGPVRLDPDHIPGRWSDSAEGETLMHSGLRALVMAGVTGAIMAAGGNAAIRDAMIVGAEPFSFVMTLMLLAIVTILRGSDPRKDHAQGLG